MTRMEWPTAMAAFFLPIRRARRQNWADKVGVAGAGGRPGALDEDVAEPYVAVGGLAGTAFSAGDVVAGCHPGPGGQVGSGREPGHVDTDLGDDRLGGPFPDPGDGVEPVTGPFERDTGLAGVRGEQRVDLVVEASGGGFEVGECGPGTAR